MSGQREVGTAQTQCTQTLEIRFSSETESETVQMFLPMQLWGEDWEGICKTQAEKIVYQHIPVLHSRLYFIA